MGIITSIDIAILNFIQTYLTSEILDKLMITITTFGNIGFVWISMVIVFLSSKEYNKMAKVMIICMLANFIIINLLIKPVIARTRPFELVANIDLLIPKPSDYSFPSGHTAISFCCLTVILLMSKSRLLNVYCILLAFLMGFSRLYLYVHYPSDVILGAILGSLISIATMKLYFKGYFDKVLEKIKDFRKNIDMKIK